VVHGSQPAADEATGDDDVAGEEVAEAKPDEADEPVSLEIPKGRMIELSGNVLDDDFKVISKLVDRNAKKLNKGLAICEAEGNVIMISKNVGRDRVI
jgi:hypothetical protein